MAKKKCPPGQVMTSKGCKKRVEKAFHRMPDGTLMTGSTHSKSSRPVAKKAKGKQRKMYGY